MLNLSGSLINIKNVLIMLPLALLALPPFFLGLFFEKEMSIHHYFVAITFLMVMVILIMQHRTKKTEDTSAGKENFIDGGLAAPMRWLAASSYLWALAGLTVLYGLSFFNAANPREALFTWLRHIDYLLTFVLMFLAAHVWQKEGQGNNFIRWLLMSLAVTGTAVAAAGILTAQGLISLEGGLTAGRLASTFQYPNSFAVYLSATLIINAYLALQSTRPFTAGAFAGMALLSCLAIIGSQSRSVLVMLPLVLVFFTLGQTIRYRAVLLLSTALGLAIIMAPFTVGPLIQHDQPNWDAFLWALTGCLTVGAAWGCMVARVQKIALPHDKKIPHHSYKKSLTPTGVRMIIIFAIICVLIALSALTVSTHTGSGGNILNSGNGLLDRISSVSVGESSLQYRIEFYRDALSMIAERPLWGWGGGGWKSAYPAYQSFNYFSTQVHSHYLQVWLEAGTAALIIFTLPFVLLLRGMCRIFPVRDTHPLAPETWAIGTAALALGMHAAIDFDLSFGSISLLLWSLLALFAYREMVMKIGLVMPGIKRYSNVAANGSTGFHKPAALLVTCLALAAVFLAAQTFVLRDAAAKAQQAAAFAAKGNMMKALKDIQAAAHLDRWSAWYPVMQAKILMAQNQSSPGQAQENRNKEIIRLAQQAVKLESYNPEYGFFLARTYLANGQLEKALSEAGRAKKLEPWQIQSYEEYNSIYVSAAVQQLLAGQEDDAGDTLRQALASTQEAVNKKKTLPPRLQRLWDTRRDLSTTPALAVTSGQSALLLGDYKLAREYLSSIAGTGDERTQVVARLWLGVAMVKVGDPSGAKLMEEAYRTSNEAVAEYNMLKQLVDF